jgi:GTPase Era involved in 16S rRNA processing
VDLREYEQQKFAMAEILRGAAPIIPDAQAKLRRHLQDLFARLAEDRFNLVVVGRFSRGKTSLMNAILGSDRLPTGIAPLTSVVTTVTYGSKEQAVLKYNNRAFDQEIPIKSLPEYITQQGNPGNIQGIKTAEVQLPSEILRRGFYFVDTPGLGSVIAENTLTTEAFLPEADAFILVTSFDSPLSEEEMRFFRAGSSSRRRIFVVLNKADLVPPEQRDGVVSFIDRQLRTIFGHSSPQIFSVSATEGQMAKQVGDSSRLAASGIPELEKQLVQFLLAEKRTEFLQSMCDRVRELLRQLPNANEAAMLRSRLDELADQFKSSVDATAKTEFRATFLNLHRVQSCEICDFVNRASWDFICKYQYRIVVEGDEQERFAKRGGFCPFHTWEYESVSSPYGACNGYPKLLDQLSDEIRAAGSISAGSRQTLLAQLQNLLPTDKDCVLCVISDKAEQECVATTAKRLEEAGDCSPQLSAICLPHLVMVVAAMRSERAIRDLLEYEAAILRRFSEDMRRFALKHDAVRRYMASREELTVAERGLRAVAGLRQVNFSPRATGAPRCEEILADDPRTRAGPVAHP